MMPALDVRDLDVLFADAGEHTRSTVTRTITPRPLDEPAGYHVGLADIAVRVGGGECLAVLGASGAGKSSFLKSLAGLQVVRRGTILVNGRDVSALPPEHRGIVYLHQEPVLFPHLSVWQNVAFPLTLRGVPVREASHRALEWLDRLQVQSAGNAPDALSGGQRHRVALARALCAEPAVLLLDEPLASLDPAVRRDVRTALLETRAATGAAMVLVTHDVDDAIAIATSISVIDRMHLSEAVAPAALMEAPPSLEAARLLGVFAEIPGEVLVAGAEHEFRWIGGVIAAGRVESGRAVACVRAHEVTAENAGSGRQALTVAERRDGAHDVALTLADAAGERVTLRIARPCRADIGDSVNITFERARIYPDR